MQKILTGALVIVLAILAYNFLLKPPSFSIGEKAPEFQAELIDGSTFSLSEMRGQYVLLDFWGSWCAPCRAEMPHLRSVYKEFGNRKFNNGESFEIVSIALEKSDKLTRRIIQDQNLNWPYHIIDVAQIVLMSNLAQKYSVKELPTKFLINPQGEIMATNPSFEELRRILTERLPS